MKNLLSTVVVILLTTQLTHAQSSTSQKTLKKASSKNLLRLKLEMESASVRDNNFEVKGNETYYLVEPGVNISSKLALMTGVQYKTREAGGTLEGRESANRDHLEEIFLKLLYKPSKF